MKKIIGGLFVLMFLGAGNMHVFAACEIELEALNSAVANFSTCGGEEDCASKETVKNDAENALSICGGGSCINGKLYDENKCCYGWPYNNDKDCCMGLPYKKNNWNDFSTANSCCLGDTYKKENGDWFCCEKGSAIVGEECKSCSSLTIGELKDYGKDYCSNVESDCPGKLYDIPGAEGIKQCCDGQVVDGVCLINTYGKMGIEIDKDCLLNGQCKFNIYKVLNIRKSDQETASVKTLVQDVILAATTFFGTLLTAIVVISGLFYILTPVNETLKNRAKKGLLAGIIGLLLVIGSYSLVRLVQFLATGGGG